DQAAQELTAAMAAAPQDVNLRFELAQMRQRQGELDTALALIEAITPQDHTVMQRRETMALQLAVLLGNVERARLAAGRVFGLRLDADVQVQLAAQMQQLGQHEQAEAVLARARRQAGGRTGALVSLMLQYQAQNRPEVAVQVAHQILRRAPSQQFNPYG